MDPLWILCAFVLGFVVRKMGLPPLVGFLGAGFLLRALGVEGGEALDTIADFGVYLLLFAIGLKLKLGSLLRPQIWGVASLHMLVVILLFACGLLGVVAAGASIFGMLDFKVAALIAFALSFSSTVFAVKVLEEKGEMNSFHGRISIGILIIQDIFAIVFMTVSSGKTPSLWAFLLLGLPLLRPLLKWLMHHCGHGELLVLLGVSFSIGAAALFGAVDLKPDLGPLILGVLVGSHSKANEMANSLLGFKDLFLTGFFLSIGLATDLTLQSVWVALILLTVVPIKVVLFFFLLTRFNLRSRTALLATLCLTTYSEFGLIVADVAQKSGWMGSEWMISMALALSMTFVMAAPLNSAAHSIYGRFEKFLQRFEKKTLLPEEKLVIFGDVKVLVCGMGRIGTGAFDEFKKQLGSAVLGVDFDNSTVEEHRKKGRNVILGDPTDSNWRQRIGANQKLQLIVLAMPNHHENLEVTRLMSESPFGGKLATIAQHQDQVKALKNAGAHAVFDYYAEAGAGLSHHVLETVGLK